MSNVLKSTMSISFPATIVLGLMLSISDAGQDDAGLEIAKVSREKPVEFEHDILPILRANCIACHNKTDAESELILETPQQILEGGSLGPAIVPGDAAQSLLLRSAAHQAEPYMPPEDNDRGAVNLSPEQLGLMKLWIDQGAKGQRTKSPASIQWQLLPSEVNAIYAVAISQYGDYVAAGRANQIFVYHIPTKALVARLTDPGLALHPAAAQGGMAHLDLVHSLAFSPDGHTLASGGYRTAKIWRRFTRVNQAALIGNDGQVVSFAKSPAGNFAAAGLDNGTILFWDPTSNDPPTVLASHSAPVRGLGFASDGSRLVSGADDQTVRIWNIDEPVNPYIFQIGHPVRAVVFVAKDGQIATGGEDGTIRIWQAPPRDVAPEVAQSDTNVPQLVREWASHDGPIQALVAGGTEGAQLFSGGQDGKIHQWNVADGQRVREFDHGNPVFGIAVHGDKTRMVSAGGSHVVKLWNLDDGQLVTEMRGNLRTNRDIGNLNRGVQLAKRHVASAKSDLESAQNRTKSEDENLKKAEEQKIKAAEKLPNKTEAAKQPVADKEAAEKELETARQQLAQAQKVKKEAVEAAAQVAAALTAVHAARDQADKGDQEEVRKSAGEAVAKVEQLDKTAKEKKEQAEKALQEMTAKVKQIEEELKKLVEAAKKAVDERTAAQRALEDATRNVERARALVETVAQRVPVTQQSLKETEEALKVQEGKLGSAKQRQADSEKAVGAVAFSPDGTQIATGGDDRLVHTWNSETGAVIDVISAQNASVVGVAYTSEGSLVSVARNRFVLAWELQPTWRLAHTIGAIDSGDRLVDRVTALHFSPRGNYLATGCGEPSRSGQIHIWRTATAQLVCAINDAHSDTVLGLEFSPDGNYIASCGADRFMKVFDAGTGAFVRSFEGHTHHVLGVSWRADGRQLATCGADKVIKIWDFQSGEQKKTIGGFGKEVTSIQYVAVGDHVVVSAGDKTVSTKNSTGDGGTRLAGDGSERIGKYGGDGGTGLGGATDFVYCARCSVDGKTFAAGGQDSVLRVWLEGGESLVTFEPPPAKSPTSAPDTAAHAAK